MRKVALLFILFLSLSTIYSQEVDESYRDWGLSFSFSSFVNQYPGVQIGMDKSISKNWKWQSEIAYLFQNDLSYDFGGYRAKNGLKYFYNGTEFDEHSLRYFLVGNMFVRHVFLDTEEDFSRLGGAFFQRISYEQNKLMVGPAFGWGMEYRIIEKILLQIDYALGPGVYRIKYSDIPDDAERMRDGFSFDPYDREGTFFYPILAVTCKLIVRL